MIEDLKYLHPGRADETNLITDYPRSITGNHWYKWSNTVILDQYDYTVYQEVIVMQDSFMGGYHSYPVYYALVRVKEDADFTDEDSIKSSCIRGVIYYKDFDNAQEAINVAESIAEAADVSLVDGCYVAVAREFTVDLY